MGEHQQRPRLSAAVLVYNGVRTIERCVRSLVFCDEILVVDDFSTDGTWELLQDLPVRAVRHPHETFAKQRAFARDLSKGVWLLSMDADEVVSEELAEGILAAVEAGVCDCYYLRIILGEIGDHRDIPRRGFGGTPAVTRRLGISRHTLYGRRQAIPCAGTAPSPGLATGRVPRIEAARGWPP